MPRTRIKICGITTQEAAAEAAQAGADAIGFIFVRSSPRQIEPQRAWEIAASLPPMVSTVGVFMNASLDAFCEIEEQCPTTLSQLHGNEAVEVVRKCGPGVIKGIRFDEATIAADLARWDGVEEVEAILVDGSSGGEGTALPWARLAEAANGIGTPIILAGGLDPDNVAEAIGVVQPYAVDVSSGVESERGVKDLGKIRAFCQAVNGC